MTPNEFNKLNHSVEAWITENFSPDRTSEEFGYELASYVVSISMTNSTRLLGDIQGSINEVLRVAKDLWGCAQECIKRDYQLDLSDNGIVVFILTMCTETKNWIYASNFMEALGVVYPDILGSAIPEVVDRATIDNIDKADTELIKEFFETFQKLGTYHRNPAEYETDEQRELHKHLMALYYKISGT